MGGHEPSPTSPLTEGSDVDAALAQLVAADADAIVGVSKLDRKSVV